MKTNLQRKIKEAENTIEHIWSTLLPTIEEKTPAFEYLVQDLVSLKKLLDAVMDSLKARILKNPAQYGIVVHERKKTIYGKDEKEVFEYIINQLGHQDKIFEMGRPLSPAKLKKKLVPTEWEQLQRMSMIKDEFTKYTMFKKEGEK